ncbi:MAG: alpha/beta fold hydrolase, partial [Methanomicrobium sp.]|nr:alpha/beta fold hydrolase [Methanomicrobium sp.]
MLIRAAVLHLHSCDIMKYDRSKVKITKTEQDILEGFVRTSGGQVWFKIVGTDKEKTPFLLLHGGPGACSDYFEPLSELSDERPVIFYDQLGCGNSDKPDDMSLYSVENYVKEVGEVRDALGLSEIYILGQSWGGGLMAAYASSKGADGIKGLIFSSPLISTDKWIFDQKSYLSELPEYIQKSVRIAEETGVYDSA